MDWTEEEVELIVADYFSMLLHELKGESYSKTAHRKALSPLLHNRNSNSIEFKHQNISAVLKDLGQPFIKGYKYRDNYQKKLFEAVALFLDANQPLWKQVFETFANKPASMPASKVVDFDAMRTDPPEPTTRKKKSRPPLFVPRITNYLEKEQNNRSLGAGGELLIIEFEKVRLEKEGLYQYISDIQWIAKDKGDGAGFDILSKNDDGSDRFIEVKTTKLTKETPIYVTKNEMEFAKIKRDNFFLYRVFSFEESPGLFIRSGEYQDFCSLEAQTFKGFF